MKHLSRIDKNIGWFSLAWGLLLLALLFLVIWPELSSEVSKVSFSLEGGYLLNAISSTYVGSSYYLASFGMLISVGIILALLLIFIVISIIWIRRNQAELKISNVRYGILQDTSRLTIFDYKPKTDHMTYTFFKQDGKEYNQEYENYFNDNLYRSNILESQWESYEVFFRKVRKSKKALSHEFLHRDPDDQFRWYRVNFQPIWNEYGNLEHIVGSAIDIDDLVRARDHALTEASVDAMTQLLNRSAVQRAIKSSLEQNIGRPCALIIADLDDLKKINDSFGHTQGDHALIEMAGMLREHFQTDLIGRIGGDEFLVFLIDVGDKKELENLLTAFIQKFSQMRFGSLKPKMIHGSIGAVLGLTGTDIYEDLFEKADRALYHVKRNGKCDFAIFAPEMDSENYQYQEHRNLQDKLIKQQQELELMSLHKVLELAVISSFEYICLIDLNKGTYKLYNDGQNTHTVTNEGDFDQVTQEIRDNHVLLTEREEYYHNAILETVAKRMEETNGDYHYRYHLEDGEREAEFYWYEATHTQLLMTVRRIRENSFALSCQEIEDKHKTELLVERLLDYDYEFLSRISVISGLVTVYGYRKELKVNFVTGDSYQEKLPAVFSYLISEVCYEKALQALSLETIQAVLAEKAKYSCIFPTKEVEGNKKGFNRWTCAWLDQNKTDIVISRINVTELVDIEKDPLTGLYNRAAFYSQARERLDSDLKTPYVIIRFDVDRFKAYNDIFGIAAGDQLLAGIGKAILDNNDPQFIFGRLESDHFVGLIPMSDLQNQQDSYNRIVKSGVLSTKFHLRCSIGVYEITDRSVEISLMCDRALLALRTVKQNYSHKIAWYDDQLRQDLIEEQALIEDMNNAIEQEQFVLYFQPQVNYDDGSLIGAEALVRWQHPKRGLIMPGKFIPLFEKNGFIAKMDAYVWEKCCQYLAKWQKENSQILPLSVSINISRFDIYDPQICDKLKALVEKYELPFTALKLEITESAYMDNPERLLSVVRQMQEMGFTVEMDDFGSGYSSLTTLKDVPVDILKLDMCFLRDSLDNARSGNILSSIIRMAHWLRLPVIAEGVETKEQAEYLKNLNCFFMQGYLFGKPMPAEEFERLLKLSKIGVPDRYIELDMSQMEAFWDATSQASLIFNNFLGAACILDYCANSVEIIQANNDFFVEIGITRQNYDARLNKILDELGEESRQIFLDTIKAAIASGEKKQCEILYKPTSLEGRFMYLHCTFRVLAKALDRYSIYLAIQDITELKRNKQIELKQAQDLRAENHRNHLLLQYLNVLVFNYDYAEDLLYYEVNQPHKGLVTRKVEHYLDYLTNSVVVHPDYIDSYRLVYAKAKLEPIQGTFEYMADNFGLGYRWCRGHYASVADDQGQVYSMVGIVYDIQDEKTVQTI